MKVVGVTCEKICTAYKEPYPSGKVKMDTAPLRYTCVLEGDGLYDRKYAFVGNSGGVFFWVIVEST